MAYRPYESDEMAADGPASELASPRVRLVAWIIDVLIYSVVAFVALLAVLFIGLTERKCNQFLIIETCNDNFSGVGLGLFILALLVVFIVQLALLATRGQTIGKIIMKIRIVDAQTGRHPGWARLILLRIIVNSVIIVILNILPGAGVLYFVVDSLFIFRAGHRTIHDLIAGTRVDKVMG